MNLPYEKKRLSDATYEKYRRRYRKAKSRIGTPLETPNDIEEVVTLEERFRLADRPIPSAVTLSVEEVESVQEASTALDAVLSLMNPQEENSNG